MFYLSENGMKATFDHTCMHSGVRRTHRNLHRISHRQRHYPLRDGPTVNRALKTASTKTRWCFSAAARPLLCSNCETYIPSIYLSPTTPYYAPVLSPHGKSTWMYDHYRLMTLRLLNQVKLDPVRSLPPVRHFSRIIRVIYLIDM